MERFGMSRRDVFLIAGLASLSKSALGYARPRPRFLIGDGVHPKGADVFEVQYHPSGAGFQAQFFRDGDLVAHADLLPDVTVGEVRTLGDQWFAAFDCTN
jgi:hypothetical protein